MLTERKHRTRRRRGEGRKREDKREQEVLQSPDREGIVKEERSNSTEQTSMGKEAQKGRSRRYVKNEKWKTGARDMVSTKFINGPSHKRVVIMT